LAGGVDAVDDAAAVASGVISDEEHRGTAITITTITSIITITTVTTVTTAAAAAADAVLQLRHDTHATPTLPLFYGTTKIRLFPEANTQTTFNSKKATTIVVLR